MLTEARRRKILYILSPGLSGSTLLTLLIATHPDVATIGERRYLYRQIRLKKYADRICKCGELVSNCKKLLAVFEAGQRSLPAYMRHLDFPTFKLSNHAYVNRIAFRLARAEELGYRDSFLARWMSLEHQRLCEANAVMIDLVLEAKGASIFLDSSKSPGDVVHMHRCGLFDISIIHLTRDGRGQFQSYLDRYPSSPVEEAAAYVLENHESVRGLLGEWQGRLMSLRYEDLCRRPLEELRRIASFVGVEPDGMSTDFADAAEHLVGNQRLFRAQRSEIVDKERWRKSLDTEELHTFERIAGESNRLFGYTD